MMNLLNTITVGLKEIWAHKFRSLLTMLGIILGVASLVGMSAIIKGMENGMRDGLIAVGGLEKVRGEEQPLPARQQHLADQAQGITMQDVYALKNSASLVKLVTPEMRLSGSGGPSGGGAMLTHGGKSFSAWRTVGTWPSAIDMEQHVIQYGRMFNEIDDENARSVCVIGTGVRDELFRSAAGSNNIPDPRLSQLSIKVADIDQLEPSLQQARNVLMSVHKGIEDFSFQTQENWSEQITTAIRNARLSGGIIAGISLLVGGIGIMNIMLASITERIREIGIRKAIGATHTNIFIQILVESVVIALLGGLAGLATSYGLVTVLSLVSPTENTPVITLNAMFVAFIFSAAVGVLAGLFPAFKASNLDPIQALRY